MGGGAVASSLPISPLSHLYDDSVASVLDYDMQLCRQALANSGMSDMDGDGMLEYVSYSVMHDAELTIIVCGESADKGDVCNKLAEDLASVGVRLNVREFSWADYLSALYGDDLDGDGEPDVKFDLYYAEVKLGADFDLSALLTENGAVNFGGIADENYATYINNFLAAGSLERGERLRGDAALYSHQLAHHPVCFERQEVITHRNVVTGIEVTSSNVFYNIADWTITFSDEERE